MYFVLQTPSLEHAVGVKVVASLWNHPDMFAQIAQSFNGLPGYYIKEERREWKTMEERVKSKVSALPLPQLCKHRLLSLVKPLGIEIIDWCRYHSGDNKYHFLGSLLPRQFCWTLHGSIDYTKTAELMVKDDKMNMQRRLEFACVNGLEREAAELIELVPKNRRHEYYDNTLRNVMKDDFFHLIILVTTAIDGDGFNPIILPACHKKDLFEDALRSGNRGMCEYLFKKLHDVEKEQVLEDCRKLIYSCRESPTCSLLYYLSLMNEEQQARMFPRCISDLLICFLRWPAQTLFVEALRYGWRDVNIRVCSTVLLAIILKIRLGFRDYDYSQLFGKCWRLWRDDYGPRLLDDDNFFDSLLLTKREEFIKLILNEAPWQQILALCNKNEKIGEVLLDESVISEAALMECKENAALKSSNNENDVEKRLRSEYVSRLVDIVMERRL